MLFEWRSLDRWPALLLFASGIGVFTGCASPGAPRPPSLQLPELARAVTAVRAGSVVEIRFQTSSRTTDGQALRGNTLQGSLCRQETRGGPCKPVDTEQTATPLQRTGRGPSGETVLWTDVLPPSLNAGPPRPVGYRVTLKNDEGKSAGPSDPVYVAAGSAPPPVTGISVRGDRRGALLAWTPLPDGGDVLLERTQLDPKPEGPPLAAAHTSKPVKGTHSILPGRTAQTPEPAEPGSTWLVAPPRGIGQGETIDGTVSEGATYSYVAVRRVTAKAGGRSLELRSAPSTPVEITWRDVYPPPAPEQLTGIGYVPDQVSPRQTASPSSRIGYAVDLVWQPVDDPRVTGYLVSRQALTASGAADGVPQRLTNAPEITPAFHDTTANPGTTYRYAVSSTDARGNTSSAMTVVVQPSSR